MTLTSELIWLPYSAPQPEAHAEATENGRESVKPKLMIEPPFEVAQRFRGKRYYGLTATCEIVCRRVERGLWIRTSST